jgi:hypothetical protein
MKKNLTSLTGILLLIAIMIAGGCYNESNNNELEILKEDPDVIIVLKAAVEKEHKRKHLEMYNSDNPDSLVVDSLVTGVKSGEIIIWDRKPGNGIKRVIHVRPVLENGILMPEAAKEMSYEKKKVFMIKIPVVPNDTVIIEKYEIVFEDDDKNTWCIDPYLRIPPPTDRGDQ